MGTDGQISSRSLALLGDLERACEDVDKYGQGEVQEGDFREIVRSTLSFNEFSESSLTTLIAAYRKSIRGPVRVQYSHLFSRLRAIMDVDTDSVLHRLRQGVRRAASGGVSVRGIFERVDVRGTGHATRRDTRNAIESKLKINLRDEELLWLMYMYDDERDGLVDYVRMLDDLASDAVHSTLVTDPKKYRELMNTFDRAVRAKAISDPHFDMRRAFRTKNGIVERKDFERGLNILGLMLTDKEVDALLHAMTTDKGKENTRGFAHLKIEPPGG